MSNPFEVKGWAGKTGRVIGKCKYCNSFSFAEVMMVDKEDKRPYHPECKEKQEHEDADQTKNFQE